MVIIVCIQIFWIFKTFHISPRISIIEISANCNIIIVHKRLDILLINYNSYYLTKIFTQISINE